MDGWMDGWINGWVGRSMDEWMDGWMHGLMQRGSKQTQPVDQATIERHKFSEAMNDNDGEGRNE